MRIEPEYVLRLRVPSSKVGLGLRIKPSLELCYHYNYILCLILSFICPSAPGEQDLLIFCLESALVFTLYLKLLINHP